MVPKSKNVQYNTKLSFHAVVIEPKNVATQENEMKVYVSEAKELVETPGEELAVMSVHSTKQNGDIFHLRRDNPRCLLQKSAGTREKICRRKKSVERTRSQLVCTEG